MCVLVCVLCAHTEPVCIVCVVCTCRGVCVCVLLWFFYRFCISNKLPCDTDAAGAQTTS